MTYPVIPNTDLIPTIELIYDILATENVASIDFDEIPQTYKYLKLMGSLRSDNAGVTDAMRMRLNDNSVADDYAFIEFMAYNSTYYIAEYVTNETAAMIGIANAATADAGRFGGLTLWMYDYTNTNKRPTWITVSPMGAGVDAGIADIQFRNYAGMFDNVEAVSRLTIFPNTGSNWLTGSRLSLYGVN